MRSNWSLAPCIKESDVECIHSRPGCFGAVFLSLYKDECMVRLRPKTNVRPALASLPFYLMHVPWQHERLHLLMATLTSKHVGALDITLVLCANRGDVASLSAVSRACLHPYMARTQWTAGANARMADGTLSLAIKHMLAMHDMLGRQLPMAVVVENDASFAKHFNDQLLAMLPHAPLDANMLYLGSYAAPRMFDSEFHRYPYVGRDNTSLLRVRRGSTSILGTLAYVVFESGARRQIRPVVAPADVLFSFQQAPIFAPQPVLGPDHFVAQARLSFGHSSHNT